MSLVVYIEGNIGAGKSTLISHLKNKYDQDKCLAMTEPVSNWPSLKLFYENKRKYALQLQLEVMQSFHDRETLCATKQMYIFERSLYSALNIFAGQNCNEEEMVQLRTLYDKMGRKNTIDENTRIVYIYLRTSAEQCLHQITKRGKATDSYINLEYLKALEKRHDDNFLKQSNIRVINGDGKSVEEIANETMQIIDLKQFIDGKA